MKDIIYILFISTIAAILVMVIHELSKTFVHALFQKHSEEKTKITGIFKIWRYIDPIGLIFAITNYGIFSKQYPLMIKKKSEAILIGITGFLSLMMTTTISVFLYKVFRLFNPVSVNYLSLGYIKAFIPSLLEFTVCHSVILFVVNLFPLPSFDISLILAGTKQSYFLTIKKYEIIAKLVFMLFIMTKLFYIIGVFMASALL